MTFLKIFIFAASNNFNFILMEALIIEQRTKSHLRNFPKTTVEPTDLLIDMAMHRLKEEDLLDVDVSENKVRKALKDFAKQNGFSANVIDVDDFLEEYEDMVFGNMLQERSKNAKLVSEAEFKKMVERKLAE